LESFAPGSVKHFRKPVESGYNSTRNPGCNARKPGSRGTIIRTPKAVGRLTRSTPVSLSAPRAAFSASSMAASASRARSASARPTSVADTRRVVRRSSVTPSRASSVATARETEG